MTLALRICAIFTLTVMAVAQPAAEPERFASVSGRVKEAGTGAPVAGATLILRSEKSEFAIIAGPDGAYRFEGIAPGRYTLRAEADGFLMSWYGGETKGRQPLLLEAGQGIKNADITIAAAATISGRVEDETGRPVMQAEIRVLKAGAKPGQELSSALCHLTDDRGEYRCYQLEPGRYLVMVRFPDEKNRRLMLPSTSAPAAKPAAPQGYVPMYLPGVIKPEDATVLEVAAGSQLTGQNVRFRRVLVAAIRGRVIDEATGQPLLRHVFPMLRRLDAPGHFPNPPIIIGPSRFEFPMLSAGRYQLRTYDGARRARAEVVIDGTSPFVELDLVLRAGGAVRGRLMPRPDIDCTRFGSSASGGMEVSLDDAEDEPGSYTAAPAPDGTFAFESIPPGEYQSMLLDVDSRCYVKQVTLDGSPLPGNRIVVPPGGISGLILVPGAAGSIAGIVRDAEGKPAVGASVLCVSQDASGTSVSACGPDTTDQSGGFALSYLKAGKVRVIALDAWEPGTPLPAAAYTKAADVEVKENSETRLDLKLLTR